MGAPLFPRATVSDAARKLIRASERLAAERTRTLDIVAMLEARWARNRGAYLDRTAQADGDDDQRVGGTRVESIARR